MSILKAYSLPPMNCTCTLAKIVSVISRQSAAPLAHSVLQPLTLLRWAVGVPSILRSTHSCSAEVGEGPSEPFKGFPKITGSFPATSLIILQVNVLMLLSLGQQTRERPICLFQTVLLYGTYDPS